MNISLDDDVRTGRLDARLHERGDREAARVEPRHPAGPDRERGDDEQHRAGLPLDNWLEPGELEPLVRSQLRETFKAVRTAQEHLANRYRISLLA